MVVYFVYSRIGLNLQGKIFSSYSMLDGDMVPAGDPEQATYFERLRKQDHKTWLNEEKALRENYGIYRMHQSCYERL